MNSEVAVHEYTHLWDRYTMKTNPELWEKGKEVFKRTSLWNEVKASPDYADIADDDNLVLSECHARICGKMANTILSKIVEHDGELTKDTVIDWDKEAWEYINKELGRKIANTGVYSFSDTGLNDDYAVDFKHFLSMPMKALMNGKDFSVKEKEEL